MQIRRKASKGNERSGQTVCKKGDGIMKDEKTIMKERCDFCGSGFAVMFWVTAAFWLLLLISGIWLAFQPASDFSAVLTDTPAGMQGMIYFSGLKEGFMAELLSEMQFEPGILNEAAGQMPKYVYLAQQFSNTAACIGIVLFLWYLKEVFRKAYSNGPRAKVNCYGANDVREGVAIMWKEGVDVSITGNSTNPTRFQHPVAGTYKKECVEAGKKYFSVASGGGTGRTLHPDNMAAGPASYGMTDTMGRMHSDAQFAGSSSVPAHVEMMGLIGMGNNPMVGATVAVAVSVEEAAKAGKF